jgi:hypothetical protein
MRAIKRHSKTRPGIDKPRSGPYPKDILEFFPETVKSALKLDIISAQPPFHATFQVLMTHTGLAYNMIMVN